MSIEFLKKVIATADLKVHNDIAACFGNSPEKKRYRACLRRKRRDAPCICGKHL